MGIFVPMGIPDFNGGSTKGHITLKYTISGQQADKVDLEVRRGGNTFFKVTVTDPALLRIGTHEYLWDGFDENGILDTRFYTENDFNFLARIYVKGEAKFAKLPFKFYYNEVDWVDVRIDKNAKRIDVTLRVDLKDGGESGTEKDCRELGPAKNAPIVKKCPWDKIPNSRIAHFKESPIRTRTKEFEELKKLTLKGLEYHWGRNRNHFVAKDVKINEENFELYVIAVQSDKKAISSPKIEYITNLVPGRSRNWELSRILYYNVGYLEYNAWYWIDTYMADFDFKETAAHEIGHEILLAYGGHSYSKKRKDSSTLITQQVLPDQPNYPVEGEIDLMKYYQNSVHFDSKKRVVADEKDVLSLIWLSKLKFE